jgi:MarR family transcriptional repressor of mepA
VLAIMSGGVSSMGNLAIDIKVLNNRILRDIEKRSRLKAGDMISGVNGMIMGYILEHSDRDVYQRELEDEFGLTRSTISKVVNLMERKGLIERVTAEHDARQRLIRLTESARELAGKVQEECRLVSSRLLRDFDEGEIDALMDYIGRMTQNMRRGDN